MAASKQSRLLLIALLVFAVSLCTSVASTSAQVSGQGSTGPITKDEAPTAVEGRDHDASAWQHLQDQNLTSQAAYSQALELLRKVVDPAAYDELPSYTPARQNPQPAPVRLSKATPNQKSRLSSHSQRARTTLSDLSPYFTFLTSWGPIGTVLRLTVRIRYSISDFLLKFRGFIPFTDPMSLYPASLAGGIRADGHPSQAPPRIWPGEIPAQLWPEWEADHGRLAIHGPFLLTDWKPSRHRSETSFLTAKLLKWATRSNIRKKKSVVVKEVEAKGTVYLSQALALLNYSADPPPPQRPSADALWTLSQHYVLGTHGAEPQPWLAIPHLTRLVEDVHPGNASARSLLGWLEGSNELWAAWGHEAAASERWAGEHQSMAMLHHAFAAQEGDYASQLALAYRYYAGIGTTPDCGEALKWYERASTQAAMRFKEGPTGGLTAPYTHVKLSDLAGGVYGPGASAASTGYAAHRPAIQAALHSLPSANNPASGSLRDPSRLNDMLEYYSYNAQGGSIGHTIRLAKIYYQGSIYGPSESAGQVPRDYARSRELALRVARMVWPVEVANLKAQNGKRVTRAAGRNGQTADEDITVQTDGYTKALAGQAAALLGRMYLRGESVPIDYQKAWFWFWRGAEVGDRECHFGYALMRSLGMAPDQWAKKDGKIVKQGENIDLKKAIQMWEEVVKSSPSGHPEASVELGKVHLRMNDIPSAGAHFTAAARAGSPFEAFHLLGTLNARIYKQSMSHLSPPGANDNRCQAAVSFFKQAAERGDWESPVFDYGMRAWRLGDEKRALIYWSMAAERGDESAQNNIAWVLDRDKSRWKILSLDGPEDTSNDRLALIHWTRSAAQDNVDALVKLGDYYFHGIGLKGPDTAPARFASAHFNTTGAAEPPQASSSTSKPDYEKALACYAAAADHHVSALAFWNLGYLYETGLGVPRRDFHLAKRYYDVALRNPDVAVRNPEAYLPVTLSLIRLHLRALWATVSKGEESAVALFSSYTSSTGVVGGYTEAEEEILRSKGTEDGVYYDEEEEGDVNLPETYDLRKRLHRQHPPPQQQQQHQHQQHGAGNDHHHVHGDGSSSLSEDEADAMIEGAMMVIGLSALAMLVYARHAAQNRAEQERAEAEQRERQRQRDRREQDPSMGAAGIGAGFGEADDQAGGRQEGRGAMQDGARGGAEDRYGGGLPWPPDANAVMGPAMGM